VTVRLALVDYGAGNLASVRKAFLACGAEVFAPDRPGALAEADAIVVPGVGHFDRTRVLDAPWREAVLGAVARCRPLLGICLGMQWLFEGSDEAPGCEGLGLMPGHCGLVGSEGRSAGELAGDAPRATLKVPHVGWNSLERVRDSALLAGVRAGGQAYFTHSYAAPVTGACVAVTDHGGPFASAVEQGVVFGVQFHPEKSGEVGLTILRNFLSAVLSGSTRA